MKIADIAVNQVVCKVNDVKDVQTVKKNEKKELDILIGDETKSCRLVLWEHACCFCGSRM